MVEGYPDGLAGWGAPAIFKEGGRLMGKYMRLLHPFILAFFVPAALIQLLQILGLAWMINHHGQHPHHHHHHFHGHFPHQHHHQFGFYRHSHEGSEGASFGEPGHHHHPLIVPVLIGAAMLILMWLLTSLAVAAISKAVAYIYSNNEEDSSVTKSIFKSLPEALFRLFITTLWVILISAVVAFVVSLPFYLLMHIFKTALNPRIMMILIEVFVSIALLVVGFVFLVAKQVAVLEPSNYGLAALKRSFQLVQAKLPAAIIYLLVSTVVGGLLDKLTMFATSFPATGKLPFWTVYIFAVVFAVLHLLFWVYFLMVAIVLYFASTLKVDADHQYLPVRTGEDNPYSPLVVPAEN